MLAPLEPERSTYTRSLASTVVSPLMVTANVALVAPAGMDLPMSVRAT